MKKLKIHKMRRISTYQYKSIAESNLRRFQEVAKTNSYAKGKKYAIIETEKTNSLGFNIIDYNIVEL